jgi:hypothetical protein
MRPLALFAFALLALAVPASASAKGVERADVCGASGCSSVDDEQTRYALLGGGEGIDPPKPGPFYRVRVVMREGETRHRFNEDWLPSEHAIRVRGENGEPVWMRVLPETERALERATAGTTPYPASRIGDMGEPIRPTVDSVFCPACRTSSDDGGGFPWWIAIVAGGAAALLAVSGRFYSTRRRAAARPSGARPARPRARRASP